MFEKIFDPYKQERETLTVYEKVIKGVSNVSWHFQSQGGAQIDLKDTKIPLTRYVAVNERATMREMKNETDIIYSFEKPAIKYVANLDFQSGTVLLSQNQKGAIFPRHYHIELQVILLVKGEVLITTYNKGSIKEICLQNPGDKIILAPFESHKVEALEKSLILVNLIPKVPELLYVKH